MKVCLLNDSFPPAMDGVVNVVLNYAEHLGKDHGAQVVVGTPQYPDAHYEQYPYEVVAYPSLDTTALTSGYRAGYPFSGKALEALTGFGPEIIHSHCPVASTILGRLLREQVDAPVVFTYHTKYDIDIHRAVKLPVAAEETIRAMVSNIEAVDEVWVVSRGAGENLRSLGYTGDYRVMNNGVAFARGRVDEATVEKVTAGYDLPHGVPVLLFVGQMSLKKNIHSVLRAAALLKKSGQPFMLLLIAFTMVMSSVSVIIQRYYFKATRKIFGEPRRLFKMTPIHHHFELCGMSENKIDIMYVIVTLVLSLIALWSLNGLKL